MPPNGHIWQELTWSWAYSTGHPASDQRLEVAAKAAWPYAALCAWTYLNDGDEAHDLMHQAIENTSGYIERHPDSPSKKLTRRLKSVIKRLAQQRAAKKAHEIPLASLVDLEHRYAELPDAEQRVYAKEILDRFSPVAQSIVKWRWLGYTWREIAKELEMDHTAVRRAFFREAESVLRSVPKSGDSPRCG